MSTLIPTPRPIVAAPMAGGPTTVALALAVAKAGGFPVLAGGYKTAGSSPWKWCSDPSLRVRRSGLAGSWW